MRSKTRVGQDPGYCQEEENNVVARGRPPNGGLVLNHLHGSYGWYCQACVSGRTTIFSIHCECIQDRVGEETGGISQEKIERFLPRRVLEILCTSVVKILFIPPHIAFILDLTI